MRIPLILANLLAPLILIGSGFSAWGLLLLFIVHMLSLWATLVPACQWWGPAQTKLPNGEDVVWLTIDDGPDGEHTRAALDLLEAHSAAATFFFIGDRAARDPELVREVAARGHGIGNHTASHPARSFWRLGPQRLRQEIEEGGSALAEILGKPPSVFRAPAGMRNPFVHPILRSLGLPLIAWSARGFDGSWDDVDAIVARISARLEPGAIVLLHEGRTHPDGGALLLAVLPRVLAAMEDKGLRALLPSEDD